MNILLCNKKRVTKEENINKTLLFNRLYAPLYRFAYHYPLTYPSLHTPLIAILLSEFLSLEFFHPQRLLKEHRKKKVEAFFTFTQIAPRM